ncbi:MAG: glutamate 5-kinase [Thiotrichales bacterium]|nr:MAG: glutamate 5-kinase [Thiotrichales bacterium]
MTDRINLGRSRRWVIKIGSALITNEGKGLDTGAIQRWAEQIAELRSSGKELLLVSSGAVAEGMSRIGMSQRPHALYELQAVAALGQMGLIQHFESCFQKHDIHTAQVLLTHEDLSHRQRYLNARSTLNTLLEMGAIPIINENDTVATDEIRFGDNDTLAALVANLVEADALIILTDQRGLYDRDPRQHSDARLIGEANATDPAILAMCGSGGALGRGGMRTKITAAQRAARSGAATLIASGKTEDVLLQIAKGAELGTLLSPKTEKLAARKQWLAGHLVVRGSLTLDAGASKALSGSGVSLLAVGVTAVSGRFNRGDMVSCLSPDGDEIARGLANYSADEARKIMGKASHEIENILGYVDEPELIHRDNLVLL